MPRAKTKKTNSTTPKKVQSDTIELSLPTFGKIKSFTPILVILLIIASFLLGMMFEKLSYLEKNNQANQSAPQGSQTGTVQPTSAVVVANVGDGHIQPLGKSNAKVKIVEFADLRCPFCKSFHDNVLPQIQKTYINTGKVELFFRHFAFLGPASIVAANAAECANEQGKFWEFYDYMYTNQPDESDTSMYTTDGLTSVANTLGMDTNQFSACLSSNKYNQNVSSDYNDGQKAGVSGTPTFYINGVQLVGAQPYSEFQKTIDQALAKAK